MQDKYKIIFETYGHNLKKIRQRKNVTLKELSAKTKIREQYLKKIESGKAYGLTTSKIFIIAEALNTPAYLFMEGV